MRPAALRLLKLVGERSLWKNVGRLHTWLYRRTGGKIGHKTGNLTNLLLTTVGRKSGKPRTVPLTYRADGESFVLVASNGGVTGTRLGGSISRATREQRSRSGVRRSKW